MLIMLIITQIHYSMFSIRIMSLEEHHDAQNTMMSNIEGQNRHSFACIPTA